jgi:DNA repair protein RadC
MDIDITQRIKEASQLFDISLLDHIIVTSKSYYSLADNGKI